MPRQYAKKTVYRSSITGRFVKKSTVQRHPKTTETQRVKVPRTKR